MTKLVIFWFLVSQAPWEADATYRGRYTSQEACQSAIASLPKDELKWSCWKGQEVYKTSEAGAGK